MPAEDSRVSPGYLAYWRDNAEGKLYVYGRLLFEPHDVSAALLNLERNLDVASEPLAAGIRPLEEGIAEVESAPEDQTEWGEATYTLLFELMGFDAQSFLDPDLHSGLGGVPALLCSDPVSPWPGPPDPEPPPCGQPTDNPRSPGAVIQEAVAAVCPWDPCASDPCVCLNCSDGNFCNYDLCSGGRCYHPCQGGPCNDDGNPCTDDVCNNCSCTHPPISGPQCEDDGNPCTLDVCGGGTCTHPPGNNGAVCADDGNPCTSDVCSNGACTHPARSGSCPDDGNPCTDDVCAGGACTHPANTAPCPDDGNPCTLDVCGGGVCTHPPGNDTPPVPAMATRVRSTCVAVAFARTRPETTAPPARTTVTHARATSAAAEPARIHRATMAPPVRTTILARKTIVAPQEAAPAPGVPATTRFLARPTPVTPRADRANTLRTTRRATTVDTVTASKRVMPTDVNRV